MSIGYCIVLGAVILVAALCVRSIVKDTRGSGCSQSCGGNCAGCAGCTGGDDIVITVKRKKNTYTKSYPHHESGS